MLCAAYVLRSPKTRATMFGLGALSALFIFPILLALPIPMEIGLVIRRDFLPVFLIVLGVFSIADRCPEGGRSLITLVLILTLFALTLSGLWRSGASELNTVGGLLPFSDALGYYVGAVRFLHGEMLSTTVGRSLYPAALATVLRMVSENLETAVVFFVFLNAVTTFFAVRAVQRSHGSTAGALTFLLLFFFFRRFIGTTLTENLGFALGALGFAAMWRAVGENRVHLFLMGLFFLSLGMSARPGAVLVPPGLLVWKLTEMKRQPMRVRWNFALTGILVTALGFAPHFIHQTTIVSPSDTSLFGMSGTLLFSSVRAIFYDRKPNARSGSRHDEGPQELDVTRPPPRMSDPASVLRKFFRPWQESRVFSFVIPLSPGQTSLAQRIREGGLAGAGAAFTKSPYGVLNLVSQRVFYVMLYGSIPALLLFWRTRREDRHYALVVWAFVGTLLCLLFLTPSIADDMRDYAVTLPFLAVLPAMALASVMSLTPFGVNQDPKTREPSARQSSGALLSVGGTLVVLLVIGPLIAKMFSTPAVPQSGECRDEASHFHVVHYPGSYVTLTGKTGPTKTDGLAVKTEDFRREMGILRVLYPERAEALSSLDAGSIILVGWPHRGDAGYYIALPGGNLPRSHGLVTICGDVTSDRREGRRDAFLPVSIFLGASARRGSMQGGRWHPGYP